MNEIVPDPVSRSRRRRCVIVFVLLFMLGIQVSAQVSEDKMVGIAIALLQDRATIKYALEGSTLYINDNNLTEGFKDRVEKLLRWPRLEFWSPNAPIRPQHSYMKFSGWAPAGRDAVTVVLSSEYSDGNSSGCTYTYHLHRHKWLQSSVSCWAMAS